MINYLKTLLLITSASIILITASCGDDETPPVVNECIPNYTNQVVTGNFMGNSFTFVAGSAKESPFDSTEYRYVLYGETPTGDMCDNFNFDLPEKSIIFEIPKQTGTYELGSSYSLTFNDASTPNTVNAEIALCGSIEIQTIGQNQITGRLDVKVNDGSAANFLNGNFEVELCN